MVREVVKNYCKQQPTAANKLPAEFSKDFKGLTFQQLTHTVHLRHLRETGVSKVHSILHTDASALVLEYKVQ